MGACRQQFRNRALQCYFVSRARGPCGRCRSEIASRRLQDDHGDGGSGTELRFEPLEGEVDFEVQKSRRFDPEFAYRDEEEDLEVATELWPPHVIETLLKRLRDENRPQAEIIVEAARQGGKISRQSVYEIAQYPLERSLRGLTRPPRRIMAQLVSSGWLDSAAAPPLTAVYSRGVLATHFQVPPEFVEFLGEQEDS
jgi:hypothetical protein